MSSEKDIREGFEERFNIFVKREDTRVEYRIGPQKGLADINKLKVHLTRNFFFPKTNPLVIRSIWAKKFLNSVESSIFYALSKSRLKGYTTAF